VRISPVAFTSQKLTAMARKEHYQPLDYCELLKQNPDEDRYVGQVPWASETEEKVQEIFSKFAQDVFVPAAYTKSFMRREIEQFKTDLSEALDKKVEFDYLSEGSFGKTFKLTVDEKPYVLKVFHSDVSKWDYGTHGKGAEVLNAAYADENAPDVFKKFYFGKFARKDDRDGFLVTEYLDKRV
jgi:hypothetical protein